MEDLVTLWGGPLDGQAVTWPAAVSEYLAVDDERPSAVSYRNPIWTSPVDTRPPIVRYQIHRWADPSLGKTWRLGLAEGYSPLSVQLRMGAVVALFVLLGWVS